MMNNAPTILLRHDGFLDGGTLELETDEGVFYVNRRLGSATREKVFASYPENDRMQPIPNEEVATAVMTLVKEHNL